jgi:hypothetical protein
VTTLVRVTPGAPQSIASTVEAVRQPGHANLGTTSIYLQGISPDEIITAVRTRRAPMMSASAGLKL